MSGDLLSGRYPLTNALASLLGGMSNVAQSNIPARSNLEILGGAGGLSDGALAASGVGCFVAVPVDPGTVISKVSILVGATAGATMTHQFAAVYAGSGAAPVLLAQSTDTTSAAIPASGMATWTLATPVIVSNAPGGNAPLGFVYVEIMIAAATVPTAVSQSVPAGINYQWTANGPLFLASTAGSALTTTAAATMASPAAKAVAPIVILT